MLFSRFHNALALVLSSVSVIFFGLLLFMSPSAGNTFPLLKIDLTLMNLTELFDVGDSPTYMRSNYTFNRTGLPDYFSIGVLGHCNISPSGDATCGKKSVNFRFNLFQLLVDEYSGDMISQENLHRLTKEQLQANFGSTFTYWVNGYFNNIRIGSSSVIIGFAIGILTASAFLVSKLFGLTANPNSYSLVKWSLIFHLVGSILSLGGIITSALSGVLLHDNCRAFSAELNKRFLSYRMSSTTPKEAVFTFLYVNLAFYTFLCVWCVFMPTFVYLCKKYKGCQRRDDIEFRESGPVENNDDDDNPPAYQEIDGAETRDSPRVDDSSFKNKETTDDISSKPNSRSQAVTKPRINYDPRYGPRFFYPWLSLMGIPQA